MKAKELTGKVALITGASKGLGKAMALALAEAGAKLALVSRAVLPLAHSGGSLGQGRGDRPVGRLSLFRGRRLYHRHRHRH